MTTAAARALVVAAGDRPPIDHVAAHVAWANLVIAADGGLAHCVAAGCWPHVVVGDLDSAPAVVVDEAIARGVTFQRHPGAKDQTDLELAIDYAIEQGASIIEVLGGFGGRLDHQLANIALIAADRWHQAGAVMSASDGSTTVWPVRGRHDFSLEVATTVSLLPWAGPATGVTTTGVQWPLADATLEAGTPWGVSNVVTEPTQTVSVDNGVVLVVAVSQAETGASSDVLRRRSEPSTDQPSTP